MYRSVLGFSGGDFFFFSKSFSESRVIFLLVAGRALRESLSILGIFISTDILS